MNRMVFVVVEIYPHRLAILSPLYTTYDPYSYKGTAKGSGIVSESARMKDEFC